MKAQLTRKLLRQMLKPATVVSIGGVSCWILDRNVASNAGPRDVAFKCTQIFDRREVEVRLQDLLAKPLTEQGVQTDLGEIRFFKLQPLLPLEPPPL